MLQCYITQGFCKGFLETSTLTYGEHLKVTKKENCCEYEPRPLAGYDYIELTSRVDGK
jgi:hypothetical protein